jgi:hypothetical protein
MRIPFTFRDINKRIQYFLKKAVSGRLLKNYGSKIHGDIQAYFAGYGPNPATDGIYVHHQKGDRPWLVAVQIGRTAKGVTRPGSRLRENDNALFCRTIFSCHARVGGHPGLYSISRNPSISILRIQYWILASGLVEKAVVQ